MTREERELLTDIRDFSTLFYVILRRESCELFESSIERDLSVRFGMWSLRVYFTIFLASNTLSR